MVCLLGIRGGSVPMVMVQKVQQPATLFGGTSVRSQVACQVRAYVNCKVFNVQYLILLFMTTKFLQIRKIMCNTSYIYYTVKCQN